jgi:hypothetical protein
MAGRGKLRRSEGVRDASYTFTCKRTLLRVFDLEQPNP